MPPTPTVSAAGIRSRTWRRIVGPWKIDPTNAAVARTRIADLGVDVSVVEADAGTTDAYVGLVPADLILLSGIMGSFSATDIERPLTDVYGCHTN